MAHKPRLNKVIALLEEGKPAFGTFVSNGNLDGLAHAAGAGYDFVFIENEHVGMDFSQLRISFQFLSEPWQDCRPGKFESGPNALCASGSQYGGAESVGLEADP